VRGLVGLHGGTVRLESLPGVGTRVTVRLPIDCRSTQTSEGAPRMETVAEMNAAASSPALPCERRASPFGREEGGVV
jgi:cell cycle sensor histidine kinase DivJ